MRQESDLTEIEVQEGEESVRIARGNNQSLETKSTFVAPSVISAPIENEEISAVESGSIIRSPIVGTFYRKPARDKQPITEICNKVNAGKVVCIVEAMKLMTEKKVEFKGKVA